MPRFIARTNRGSALSSKTILEEYGKLLSRPGLESTLDDPNLDTRGDSFEDLDLDYSTASSLHLYNRAQNLKYKFDTFFDRLAKLSHFNLSNGILMDGFQRNISQSIGQIDSTITAIQLAEAIGARFDNIITANFIDTENQVLSRDRNYDPKTNRSLVGKEAEVDIRFNVASVSEDLITPDLRYDIVRGQVVHGLETTPSDSQITFDKVGAGNRVSNIYKSSTDYYNHGIFLSRTYRSTIPRYAFVQFYVELNGYRKSNFFSLQMGDPRHTQLWKLEYKDINGEWIELLTDAEAVDPGTSIFNYPSKAVITFEDAEIRAFRFILRTSNAEDIEFSEVDTSGMLLNQSTSTIRRYLNLTDALVDDREQLNIGTYFELSVNNVQIGFKRSVDIGVVSHKLEVNGQVTEAYLYQESGGYVDNYLLVDYRNEAGQVIESVRVPMPVVDKVVDYREILYPYKFQGPEFAVTAFCETSFMSKPGSSVDVYQDGILVPAARITLVERELDPKKLEIQIDSYDINSTYHVVYNLADGDPEQLALNPRRTIHQGLSNVVLFSERAYSTATVYLQSIIRNPSYAFSFINSSTLVIKTND